MQGGRSKAGQQERPNCCPMPNQEHRAANTTSRSPMAKDVSICPCRVQLILLTRRAVVPENFIRAESRREGEFKASTDPTFAIIHLLGTLVADFFQLTALA